ncbi:hypothetical protein KSP39_PZI012877 [Platanthera zijinensis]|uniref:Uncharacterized protein n=1 Tax=Platanthera zijinensis TaxID=2320716 RepID=A0AAP0G381_9ASPA
MVYACVMCRPLPSRYNICKTHIEVANGHYVLSCATMTTNVRNLIFYSYPCINMRTVNCTDTIFKKWHISIIIPYVR